MVDRKLTVLMIRLSSWLISAWNANVSGSAMVILSVGRCDLQSLRLYSDSLEIAGRRWKAVLLEGPTLAVWLRAGR